MALAARAADRLISQGRSGLTEQQTPDMTTDDGPPITDLTTAVYRFPTPEPEADGTLHWDATTAVTVTCPAGGPAPGSAGPTAAPPPPPSSTTSWPTPSAAATPTTSPAGWSAMHRACRNLGTRGLVMQAISAVDIAWWDLKARLLDVPLHALLGAVPHRRSRSTVSAGSPP